jgi:hypothetical protein
MATPYGAIRDRLGASVALAAVATGGVWDRPLVRPAATGFPANPGQTAAAFDADGRVKPAVVVPDEGEQADPLGPDAAMQGFPLVWLYAPPTAQGKTAIGQMRAECWTLLHGWHVATDNGTDAETRIVGRLGVRDAPDDFPAVVDYLRLQLVFIERQTF